MTLDEYVKIGRTIPLGSYQFTAEAIKRFARKYDPQPFHLDEEAARDSMFGALCASGWHTAATWMKLNMATGRDGWEGEGPAPQFGPSPGVKNLKWPKPVFAGETVSYSRTSLAHRPLASRPGWHALTGVAEAHDSTGAKVLQFDTAVLFRLPE